MLLTTFKYSKHIVLPDQGSVHILLHQDALPRDIVTVGGMAGSLDVFGGV